MEQALYFRKAAAAQIRLARKVAGAEGLVYIDEYDRWWLPGTDGKYRPSAGIMTLTQAEFNALSTGVPDVLYEVVDAAGKPWHRWVGNAFSSVGSSEGVSSGGGFAGDTTGTGAPGSVLTAVYPSNISGVVQWTKDGLDIPAANGDTYTVRPEDVTGRISWYLVDPKFRGAEVSVGAVPPVFTASPTLVGTPTVGVAITALAGTVTGTPAISYAFQWVVDGVLVGSATSTIAAFTPQAGQEGKTLGIRQTATNAAGSAFRDSAVANIAVAPGGGVPSNAWLLEDGSPWLLEDGSYFLMEF